MSEKEPKPEHSDQPNPVPQLDFPYYEPSDRETAEQKAWLRPQRLYSTVRDTFFGEKTPIFTRRVGQKMDDLVNRKNEQEQKVAGMVERLLQQVLAEQNTTQREKKFSALSALLHISDPVTGQTFTGLPKFKPPQVGEYTHQDKSRIDGQYDCLRVLLPNKEVERGCLYLLQIPDVSFSTPFTAEVFVKELSQNIIFDDNNIKQERLNFILSLIDRLKQYEDSKMAAAKLIELGRVITNWLKNLKLEDFRDPELVIDLLEQEPLWKLIPGEITATMITPRGKAIRATSFEGNTGPVTHTSVERYEGDQTIVKQDSTSLTDSVTAYYPLRTGSIYQHLLPHIMDHAILRKLIPGNSGTSRGKMVENQQRTTRLARGTS